MAASIQLANLDARLAFLALQYHLARPGSELDPETKQPLAHGLAEVATALEPQLEQAVATLELSAYQRGRLASALAGSVNELKSLSLMGGGRTTVPAFHRALTQLFPEARDDADEAVQLAAHMVDLRRRLDRMAPESEPQPAPRDERRTWWQFWRRAG